MRILVLPLSVLFLSLLSSAQQNSKIVTLAPPDDLYIPAVLDKGVQVEKAHPGDEVRLDVVEAILAGHGVVIPDGAHLYGHVVDSEPLEPSSGSKLAIEVDRAEWRHHELLLHAFVSGLGTRRVVREASDDSSCEIAHSPAVAEPIGAGRESHGFAPAFAGDEDSCLWKQNNAVVMDERGGGLKDVMLEVHRKDGSTAFVSGKRNIHLPGGLLIMLHNVPQKPLAQPLTLSAGQE